MKHMVNRGNKIQHTKKRKKRRLKKKVKIKGTIILVLIVVSLILYFPIKKKINKTLHPGPIGTVQVDWYKDLNPVHLKHAKKNGVQSFKTNQSFKENIEDLLHKDKLVQLSDNKYYRICPLTHSHAYLTPAAEHFLSDLGKRFSKKLNENDKPDYYFQISSLLRTIENQKDLSRGNGNASPNSSHYYGTTFDIPYFTVVKRTLLWYETEISDGDASKLLSEAIGELREEGRCVVVTEKNERCFHITVTE